MEHIMSIDISIIVVNHNHGEFIEQCLNSCVASLEQVRGEIIVVDNCSTDGSKALLKNFGGKISVIHNEVRAGFSANNNKAIRAARGEYLFILNPDTSFSASSMKDLINIARSTKNLGLLAPQLIYPDGSVQPSCRRFPTIGSFIARRTPLRGFFEHSKANEKHLMLEGGAHPEGKVDWVLGACMLIPRTVFDAIGLFDERFFLYVEDIDLCYQIGLHGLDVIYTTRCQVMHHHLAESDHTFFGKRSWYHFNSMIRFVLKYKFRYNYLGL